MTARTARRLARGIWGLTLLLAAADAALALANGPAWSFDLYGVPGEGAVLGLAAATIGTLIASRHPRNPNGWILCGMGPGLVLAWLPKDYAVHALLADPGSLPGGEIAAWLGGWAWILGAGPTLFLLLLFPDGSLRSPRWRPVLWSGVALLAAMAAFAALAQYPPGKGNLGFFVSPATWSDGAAGVAFWVVFVAAVALALVATGGLAARFRGATGERRQQLKWFVFAGSVAVLATAATDLAVIANPDLLTGTGLKLIGAGLGALFIGLMASIGIAILRYRLYDIDVVISKTVLYGALAAFITGVYVAIVVGIGTLVGAGGEPNVGLSILATAVLAAAFQPVRARVQRFANRLVYGERATPYEVMAGFAHRMTRALSVEEVLPGMARAAAEGVAAARSRVRLFLPGGEERVVAWPDGDGEGPFDRTVTVRHLGAAVGEVAVAKPPGEPLSPAEERLLADLASQAGLALHNVRLTVELQSRLREIEARAAELRASRQRIVTAQDVERRRLERAIHEGAEHQLASIEETLRLADRLLEEDPGRAGPLLERLGADADSALETLRDLARGLFPPLLADRGLVAALEAQVRKEGFAARIEKEHGLLGARFDPRAEAAVYFCCLEALQNAARHAPGHSVTVELAVDGGRLAFRVVDRGPGFDPQGISAGTGLQNMRDRVEALDGSLEIRSGEGRGTVVEGRIPAISVGAAGPAPHAEVV